MPDHLKIEQPKQVIVEGNDDVRVFGALAKHLNIRDVQIHGYGGIDNLRRFLDTFRNLPEFGRVQSLAVVADANSDRDKRERRICNALSAMALPTPSHPLEIASNGELQVAYLVIPHNATGTMIEDVCLNSVSTDPAMECVDRYFECLSQTEIEGPKKVWMSKARLHAFLASRDRPGLRLGEAAESGIWPLETDAFRPLLELIRML